MTRTEIQNQINVIKENPEYNGSLSYLLQQLEIWLISSGVSNDQADKILNDIQSYAI